MPRNKSSLTNRTVAFTPGPVIDVIEQKNNIRRWSRYHAMIRRAVGPHNNFKVSKVKSQTSAQGNAFSTHWRSIMADILVVDDDEVIRDTLCELFSADYVCLTADTAEDALAKLEAQAF